MRVFALIALLFSTASLACDAVDESSLAACVAGASPAINIKAKISCVDCSYVIRRDVSITGQGRSLNAGTGITRSNACGELFRFVRNRPTISKFYIYDTQNSCSKPQVVLNATQDALVDSVSFHKPGFAGVSMFATDNSVIKNSMVVHSQRFGIWTSALQSHANTNYKITGNFIGNAPQAGATLSGINYEFSDNDVRNTHHNIGWESEPQGGQVFVNQHSYGALIKNNDVRNGAIRGVKNAHGIEVSYQDIQSVVIEGNTLSNHDGYGVSMNRNNDRLGGPVADIHVRDNYFSNNRINTCVFNQRDYSDIGLMCWNPYEPVVYRNFRNGQRVN